eukprot:gene30917-37363_t
MSRKQLLDRKLSQLEEKIVEKNEVVSGFSELQEQVRHLAMTFKFHDRTNTGLINFEDFMAVMLKFNIAGVNRELKELFTRYDEDMNEEIDCNTLALQLYGFGVYKKLDSKSKSTTEEIHSLLVQHNKVFVFMKTAFHLMQNNGSAFVDKHDVTRLLNEYVGYRINHQLITSLLTFFPGEDNSTVNLMRLLQEIKSGMNYHRKRVVHLIYERLCEDHQERVLSASTFLQTYVSQGVNAEEALAYMTSLSQVLGETHNHHHAVISFPVFLDFYRCISMFYTDDDVVWGKGHEEVHGSFSPAPAASRSPYGKHHSGVKYDDSDERFERYMRTSFRLSSPLNSILQIDTMSPSAHSAQGLGSLSGSVGMVGGFRGATSPKSMSNSSGSAVSLTRGTISPVLRRVVVERSGGQEEVVDLLDELTTSPYDEDVVKRQLRERGVRDVVRVKF